MLAGQHQTSFHGQSHSNATSKQQRQSAHASSCTTCYLYNLKRWIVTCIYQRVGCLIEVVIIFMNFQVREVREQLLKCILSSLVFLELFKCHSTTYIYAADFIWALKTFEDLGLLCQKSGYSLHMHTQTHIHTLMYTPTWEESFIFISLLLCNTYFVLRTVGTSIAWGKVDVS